MLIDILDNMILACLLFILVMLCGAMVYTFFELTNEIVRELHQSWLKFKYRIRYNRGGINYGIHFYE